MDIPRYWQRATRSLPTPSGHKRYGQTPSLRISAWGWHHDSEAAARQHAEERLQVLIERLGQGLPPPPADERRWYAYGSELPLREEILSRHGTEAEPEALITRSASGPRILNTKQAMFVDIDLPAGGCLLLGGAGRRTARAERRIEAVAATEIRFSARVYRTPNGLRLLVTHQTYDPTSQESEELLRALGADPLFMQLCRRQSSYRARLSAKPWRVGVGKPPARWPVPEEQVESYQHWLHAYETACKNVAACQYEKTIGSGDMAPVLKDICRLHDAHASAGTRLG